MKESVEKYLADFENKKLIRDKTSKTGTIYGKTKGSMKWGTAPFMMNAMSEPTINFGYAFVKKSPYFRIKINPTKNQAQNQGKMEEQTTIDMYLYLTKAQAKQLVELLSDQYVAQQMLDMENETIDEEGVVQPLGDAY